MPNFRTGVAGMAPPQGNQKDSSPFPGFIRGIIWTKDKEKKYVAFLNGAADMPTVDYHPFIEVGKWKSGKSRYEEFISRTDPGVGESTDDLSDRLGRKAQQRTLAVAVELEPTYSTVNGRKRPTGFAVKTETFERTKEDGSKEEVEAPVIGMVVQSPRNFFGWVGSFDESTAPIEDTPVEITRRGKDASTQYDFTPYIDQPIDYTNLVNLAENISYLRDEDVDLTGEPKDVALAIGTTILEKRLGELTDKERYERLVSPIDYLEDKWGNNNPPKPAPRNVNQPAKVEPTSTPPAQLSFEEMSTSSEGDNSKFEQLRKMHETV